MDAWTFVFDWWRRFGTKRVLHPTAHDVLMAAPGLGDYFRQCGVIPASCQGVGAALSSGFDVIVWPGGDVDAMRNWRRRDQAVLGGRMGFIPQAIRSAVPIVPVASVGGHDTVFVLSEGRWIATGSTASRGSRTSCVARGCRSCSAFPSASRSRRFRHTFRCQRRSAPSCSTRSTSTTTQNGSTIACTSTRSTAKCNPRSSTEWTDSPSDGAFRSSASREANNSAARARSTAGPLAAILAEGADSPVVHRRSDGSEGWHGASWTIRRRVAAVRVCSRVETPVP